MTSNTRQVPLGVICKGARASRRDVERDRVWGQAVGGEPGLTTA